MQLFLCRTPIQLLRALHLLTHLEEFKEISDICVFNSTKDAIQLVNRLKEERVFRNVYYIDDSQFYKAGALGHLKNYFSDTVLHKIIKNEEYSKVISFNIDSIDNFIVYNMLKNKEGFEYYLVEDAPAIYSYKVPSKRARIIISIFGLKYPIFNVNKWFFSVPEKMSTQNTNPVVTLPRFQREDKAFIELANRIFSYEKNQQLEEADVIIMEESLYTDGLMKNNRDYQIMDMIRMHYPDKKMVVKLHPRTKENRFSEKFTVLGTTNIPWELYLLNRSYEDKIFISIICTTLVSQKILYGDEYKSVSLLDLVYDDVLYKNGTRVLEGDWEEKVRSYHEYYQHEEYIYIPKNIDEMFLKLDEWLIK